MRKSGGNPPVGFTKTFSCVPFRALPEACGEEGCSQVLCRELWASITSSFGGKFMNENMHTHLPKCKNNAV